MKKDRTIIILSTAAVLLPVIAGLCMWELLPEQIAVHWNLEGTADGWASKNFAVFGITGIILLCHALCIFGIHADPKRKNINGKLRGLIYWTCPAVSVLAGGLTLSTAAGYEMNVAKWVMLAVAAILIFVGNYLPKCQPNYSVGIKLPWTLHSEENWRRTHRMAGPLWIAGGIIIAAAAIAGDWARYALLPVIIIMLLVPVIYSYLIFRKSAEK